MDDLTKVFADIKKKHKAYALQRIIKNCVGPSTLRTLAPNSKQDIIECLSEITPAATQSAPLMATQTAPPGQG